MLSVLLGALSCVGCFQREWVPLRYSAPADGSYESLLATNQCAHSCYARAAGDAAPFYRCLELCPDVTVEEANTCEDPSPAPTAFCYTQWSPHLIDETGAVTASVVDGIFEVLASELFQAAASAVANATTDDSAHEHEEASNRPEHHAAPRHESVREAPAHRDYRPAKPHKE